MKNYLSDGFKSLRQTLFSDTLNLIFLTTTTVFFLLDYFLWKFQLEKIDLYVITLNGIYPIKFLAIILIVNLILIISSYNKEKEISYLLFSTSIFLSILILILEMFYLYA